jgi:hypothetical protein
MGGSSNLLIEMQNEQADEWIREKLEDDNSGAESEEYQELATEYSYLQCVLVAGVISFIFFNSSRFSKKYL